MKLYDSHYGLNNESVVILCQPFVLRFGRYIFLLQVTKCRHKTKIIALSLVIVSRFPIHRAIFFLHKSLVLNTYYYYYFIIIIIIYTINFLTSVATSLYLYILIDK